MSASELSTRNKVRKLLKLGMRKTDIAKRLKISKARVSQLTKTNIKGLNSSTILSPTTTLNFSTIPLKRLSSKPPLTDPLTDPLTPLNLSSDPRIPQPSLSSSLSLSMQNRLHRLQRSYKILNAVSEERLKALKLNDRLNNIKEWHGQHFRIIRGESWILELEGIELLSSYTTPIPALEGMAITLCDNLASQIAALYGFLIAKEGHTPIHLTEIELSATMLTERLKALEKQGIVPLFEDGKGGKIWCDWSWGIGGAESNNPLYHQRLCDLAKDIANNDGWQLTKENVTGLVTIASQQSKLNDTFLKEIQEIKELLKRARYDT